MFEVAELNHKVSKVEYNKRVPELRTRLLEAQQALSKADFPVIILISGVDGGGKGDVINVLNEWMDPRYIRTHGFGQPTEDERQRPPYWRYWMALPASGTTAIFVGSWYSDPISLRMTNRIGAARLDTHLHRINQFEKELSDDGALIIKCWLHLSKKKQKEKLKRLEKDPHTRWLVTKQDRRHLKQYDEFCRVAEHVLRETSSGVAPWLIVDGSDIRYSGLTVGEHVLERINKHLQRRDTGATSTTEQAPDAKPDLSVLQALDLSQTLSKKQYNADLTKYQAKLNRAVREAQQRGISSILVFEGWDAGGKGGAIRRITGGLDARRYRVIPIAAPTDEERAHHYLWRFWRHLPRAGSVTIYDRSWYGRVLVERVEGFASEEEWMRSYQEIVAFEEALTEAGILVLKFWLHIDKNEQLRRFKEREQISYKKHKITEEDYRNREKWDAYEIAINDMVARTSTSFAPWTLVEGNDKRFARVKILKTFCDKLEARL